MYVVGNGLEEDLTVSLRHACLVCKSLCDSRLEFGALLKESVNDVFGSCLSPRESKKMIS